MGPAEHHVEHPWYPLIDRGNQRPAFTDVRSNSTTLAATAEQTFYPLPAQPSSMDTSSMVQQLQMAASRLPLLRTVMEHELQALTPNSPQLQLAQHVQQQSAAHMHPILPQQQGCSKQVDVVPLLGLSLDHLLRTTSAQGGSVDNACSCATGQLGPAQLHAAMLQHSPFLTALQAELHFLRKASGSCYMQIKEHLASVGKYLPPAADASGRRSSTGSNRPADPTSPNPTYSATSSGSARSDGYYGKGLDLQMLQQQADAGALDLIHLEDCIGSNVANLAKLAQQYDIMITAALAAAAEHADITASGVPAQQQQQQGAKAASHKGSFLGPLFGAIRGKHTASKAGQQQAEVVEYVFMKPGVCSHSNEARTYSYRAGVPPDVYSTSIHKLLSHDDSSERVLWMLSVIYARLRFAADAATAAAAAMGAPELNGGVKQWRAPDMFTRSTTKYWVHPSNILRLKLALTKQLPLLVYGADDPVSSGDIAAVAAGEADSKTNAPGQQHKVTSLVSSVYFDGPDLPVYHTRLARLDGARLVRIRYYGQRVTDPAGAEQSVFVEQKTHRDKIMGETSYKERASMRQGQMPAFLSRQVPLEDLLGPNSKKLEMLGDIQDFLGNAKQAPVMRTEYMRSAWQAYDDNAVRFSFDEDMLLLREGAVGAGNNSSWCSPLESVSQLPFSDAVRFPYGILEIKLQDKEAAPAWVHELKTSGVIIEVPKFSKFLHGMALLQPDKIREVPSWFAWREAEGVTLPASMDEVWDMTAERRARKELEWQERLEAEDPAALAAANTPEVTAMLMLLRAPRVYASSTAAADTGAIALTAVEDPASKPALSAAPSYDLTASAATQLVAPAGQPDALAFAQQAPAAAGTTATGPAQHAAGLHSYPCHAPISNLASTSTDSPNSANSGSAGIHAEQLHGPARDIMEDGQFGYAGGMHSGTNNRSGSGNGLYRGSGGCMQPGLGLVALPGRSDSFSCSRGPTAPMVDSPTMDSPSEAAGLNGNSPSFGAQPLSVRVIMPHSRSLSSSSLASSDLHATGSSSSLGPDALPHFTTYSSPAHSLLHSPTQPGSHYGSLQHADSVAGYPRVHLAQQPAHGHRATTGGSAGRPHSRDSSSGGTCDSWKLSTVNPLFSAGPLARSSATGGAACSTGLHGDSAYKPAPGRSMKESLWATGSPEVRRGWHGGHDQDGVSLGPVRSDDVVLDLSKLGAQAATPSAALAAAALAAGAGRPQVIQVHYTGAVEAVPVPAHANPTPSPRQVRELAQLLPPAAPAGSDTAVVAALATADAEVGRTDQLVVDGIVADSSGKDVSRKGSRGYRQRMQQWKASLSGRMRGMRGSRGGSSASMAPAYSMRSNEHMLGFAGSGPRQPTFVKARADPKTFFANERTFLQWLQISVLVMMTGLGMLTGSTLALNGSGGSCMSNVLCSASRISGAIIAPVSILFMIYAIYLYQKRTKQLLTRSTLRYDDARGPWILTILLILVTIVVIVLALEAFKVSVQT